VIREFVKHEEVDQNAKDLSGRNALMTAIYNENSQAVLEFSFDVNSKDGDGYAAPIGHVRMVMRDLHAVCWRTEGLIGMQEVMIARPFSTP
jgi:hypothetical protein